MNGLGILRGLGVTMRHFVRTVTSGKMSRQPVGGQAVRQAASETHGVFTVQYPEQRLALPERFRSFPILLYDDETGSKFSAPISDFRLYGFRIGGRFGIEMCLPLKYWEVTPRLL